MGRKSKKINVPEWFRFVESYKNKIIEKMYRRLKVENLVAKVHGPKQSCKFDVCYAFPPENEKEMAAGFMRSGWTTFCFENDIEENNQLLFQWIRSNLEDHFNFTVKIFNKDEIGLHVGAKHHYSHSNHRHRKRRPHY
ncbi:putative DNA-binding pseudobarrel domain superfamily [Helianthus anomalus]